MLSDSDSSFQNDSPLKKAATSVSQDFLSNCGLPGANQSASLPSDSSLPPKKIALSVSPCLTGQCSMSEIDDSCESAIAVYQICQFFLQQKINPQSATPHSSAVLSVDTNIDNIVNVPEQNYVQQDTEVGGSVSTAGIESATGPKKM